MDIWINLSGFAKLSVEVISTRHRFSFIKVVRRCHPVDLEEYGHFDLLAYKASYDQDYLAGRMASASLWRSRLFDR